MYQRKEGHYFVVWLNEDTEKEGLGKGCKGERVGEQEGEEKEKEEEEVEEEEEEEKQKTDCQKPCQ